MVAGRCMAMQWPAGEGEDLGLVGEKKAETVVELVSQDVQWQPWLYLKKELTCSVGPGEHILSESKGTFWRWSSTLWANSNRHQFACDET